MSNRTRVRLILEFVKLLVFVNLGLLGAFPTPRVHDCKSIFLKNEYGMSPKAINLCRPVAVIEEQSLRSTARGQLDVTHLKTSTYGRRDFSFASTSAWNSLPNYLKDSSVTLVRFKRSLKTFCFSKY